MERGARIQRSLAFWAIAFGCFAAGIILDGRLAPSPVHVVLPFAAFAGYLLGARLAVRAWWPDADDIWRSDLRWAKPHLRALRPSGFDTEVQRNPSYVPKRISPAPRRPR